MEFRLLVEAQENTDRPVIFLSNRRWSVTEPLDMTSRNVPQYACISYVWGSGRLANSFHPSAKMSDHTLPALTAAMRDPSLTAFWIDAFCVPVAQPQKGATLESMGAIYGRAARVVVVLSNTTWHAIDQITRTNFASAFEFSDSPLKILEQDMWIKSVWTYQEVVNSQGLFITAEGANCEPIEGESFLNALGQYLELFRQANGLTTYDLREHFPYVDAFEDLIADWRVAVWCGRSALQVMSGMWRRKWFEEANYFYAMIGTITGLPSRRSSHPSIQSLSESFMGVCEEKGDFSFIYSTAPRDTLSGRLWRPSPTLLQPVLSWHTWGESQRGERHANGLTLKDMFRLTQSHIVNELYARHTLERLRVKNEHPTGEEVTILLLSVLKQMGFTGCGQHLTFFEGLFFPQDPIMSDAEVEVWVSTSITWTFGAPGIAIITDAGRKQYISGVFLGDRSTAMVGSEVEMLDNVVRECCSSAIMRWTVLFFHRIINSFNTFWRNSLIAVDL